MSALTPPRRATRRSEANRTKSIFLANMSHELRTPLNAIIGYTALVREESGDMGFTDFDEDLGRVELAARHLLELINEVLDLAKVEAGHMAIHLAPIDLPGLCEELRATISPMCARGANRLVVEIDEDLAPLINDRTRLRQVMLNLLSNASKFTRDGLITLRVAPAPDAPGAQLIVEDTGAGMNQEALRDVFEAFVQASASTARDHGGTGLGLPISRKLCELMGGTLEADSAPGVGSIFTVTLPDLGARP